MRRFKSPKDAASYYAERSRCAVRVGAVLVDSKGTIISAGWNGPGADGFGIHAEAHALKRANRKRIAGATLYVAARRKIPRNATNARAGGVTAKPCAACQHLIKRVKRVIYRDKSGTWVELRER